MSNVECLVFLFPSPEFEVEVVIMLCISLQLKIASYSNTERQKMISTRHESRRVLRIGCVVFQGTSA